MKRLALAAAGAAVLVLTACSHSAAPTAASAGHSATAVPVSCGQQYRTWEHGHGKGIFAALHAVGVAGTAGDTQVLTAALKKAGPAVARGARHPIPACADPMGYWNVLLMHVNAAIGSTASTGNASGVRAAMKDVPGIEHKLTAELKRTAG
jgi:hypothetical protein